MSKRWLRAVTSCAFLVVPLVAIPGAAQAKPNDDVAATASTMEWKPCEPTGVGECATVQVPIDWKAPSGEKITLTVGRLKAIDRGSRKGVLFVNPGGPGVSPIDYYILGQGNPIPDTSDLRKYFDIVTWDPRGVGRSHEILCDAELIASAPTAYPDTEQEFRDLVTFNARLGADCRARTGPLFDYLDTASTVRDMDAIRVALGEAKVSYLGLSYGTMIGQQYAELFPSRVRAMAIDANLDHSITDPETYIVNETEDLEGSLFEFADWCAQTTNCPLHNVNVVKLWDELLARATAGTLIDPVTGEPETDDALRLELNDNIVLPEFTWYDLAARLGQLAGRNVDTSTTEAVRAGPAGLASNAYQAIWCQDWSWRVTGYADFIRFRDAAKRVAPHTELTSFWSDDIAKCLGWPAQVRNPQHRLSVRGTPTILVIGSRYDANTSHVWSESVASQIPNSAFFRYDGVGHAAFNRNKSCTRPYVERYLVNLQVPAPGSHCPAAYPTQPPSVSARGGLATWTETGLVHNGG